jgi:selenocysteine lyase/cysteine desulfurase
VHWDGTARRFEGGTYNMAGTAAMDASLQLIADAGVPEIWAHVDHLCDRWVHALAAVDGARVLSDRSEEGRSGIVSIRVDGMSPDDLADRLNAHGFVCGARGGGVRIAPHGYNNDEEIDALVALVAATADEKDRQAERN